MSIRYVIKKKEFMLVKVSVVNGDPPYEVGDDIAFQGHSVPKVGLCPPYLGVCETGFFHRLRLNVRMGIHPHIQKIGDGA